MADDEVRNPAEPQRPATPNRGKRREPPLINATAGEVVDPNAPAPGTQPFESASGPDMADATVHAPSMAAAGADLAAESASPAEVTADGSARPNPEAASSSGPLTPERRGSKIPALLSVLGVLLVLMLGALLYTLYNPPAVATADTQALNRRIAALEARPTLEPPNLGPVEERVSALETSLNQLKADLSQTRSRLDDLANMAAQVAAEPAAAPQPATPAPAPAPAVDLAPMQGRIADLDRNLTALQQTVAALPKTDPAPMANKLADLEKTMSGLQSTVAALPKVDLAPVNTKLADLDSRLTPIQTELEKPKTGMQVTEARQQGNAAETRAAPLAVTAQAILRLLDEGKPFGPELTALQSLGTDDAKLAALRPLAQKGAPTNAELLSSFGDVEDRILRDTTPKPTGSVLDRWMADARGIVKVRPSGSRPGDDPDAVVSRIDAALRAGNLQAAQTEWQRLPEAGKDASQDWASRLKARVGAEAVARSVVTDAIAAIGPAK